MKKIMVLAIVSMILISGCGKEKQQEANDLATENYDIVQQGANEITENYDIVYDETLIDPEIESKNNEKNSGATKIDDSGDNVLTSSNVSNADFALEAKINREQVRQQNKEDLMDVINSTALSDKEKQAAVDKMVTLTDIAQRESDAEMLLEAKGFTDVVVSITEDGADVILNMGDITDAKCAQIEDIVKRKTKVSPENITITPIETNSKN